mgnify:CR=1 FL=1
MSNDNNQIEFPMPGDNPQDRKSARHLPKYFRTEKNQKFLQSTIDQLLQPGVAEKVNSFVGRKTAKAFNKDDNYLDEVSKDRESYQLEPVSYIKDKNNNINYYKDYRDFINQISNLNGVNNNHSRNTSQKYYSWNPHIDWDKFSNFREYYWLPNGPQTVVVPGDQKEIESTYTVTLREDLGDYSYIFTPDALTPNPNLKLYRGVKYKFEINTPGLPLTFRSARTLDDQFLLRNEVSEQAVENGVIEIELGSETPDVIYYVADNDINLGGLISVANQSEATAIDVELEIINKKSYTTRDGWSFTNGLKVRFEGDVTPEKYKNSEWYVEGVGDRISLVSDVDVEVSFPVGIDLEVEFDAEGFDSNPFSQATGYPKDKDYITINRASKDGNFWSRYNRWFHKGVIDLAAEISGVDINIDQTQRANRPIIEFEAGLKLYNFGTRTKQVIDLVDDFTTDAFSTIEGSLGYNIDSIQLTQGMRILFLNDTDPLVNGKIFQVKFINFRGSGVDGQISLVETNDTEPLVGENVLVTQGLENAGKIYYFDGTTWNQAQEKTSVNQPPVFDVFDKDDVSYASEDKYPTTTFRGTKIFSYKTGAGATDSVLGFPLSYRSIENVGDIVFDFNYNLDSFQYQIDASTFNTNIKDGFLRKYNNLNQFEVVGMYTEAYEKSSQNVILQYIQDNTRISYPINCFNQSAFIDDLDITVEVDSVLKYEGIDYELFNSNDNFLTCRFLTDLPFGSSIVFYCKTQSPKNENGYYEIASNLEKNPQNADLETFTLGEVSDHVSSIIRNVPNFAGIFPGNSNLRDISNQSKYGTKFIKHSAPLNLVMYSTLDKESNIIDSIRFSKKEYSKFKRIFLQTAETLGFDGPVKQHVDKILTEITKDKINTMPFYFSDMVPFGPTITTRVTVEDEGSEFFALNTPFTLNTLTTKSVTVYINNVQLIHNKDYVFNSEGFLQITAQKNFGDVIEINEYETTNGSYVPPTPSKLGLYPAYEPEIFVDDTYSSQPKMIKGHDGSLIKSFDDYRDDLILELEKRIFNNIKISYNPQIHDINSYLPGLHRQTEFTREDVYQPMTTDFIQWLSLVDQDYTTNPYYDRLNNFTFNYSNLKDKNGGKLPGWWRGIYKFYFDTDRPHTHPWEMLGFTIKPTWWEEVYGPAPYTKNNSLLWEDLEAGIIRQPNVGFKINKKYARPNLTSYIPVDASGKLLGPNDCNIPLRFSTNNLNGDFVFGDNAPVESAWVNSSEYPFALLTSWAINAPASLLATGFDRSRQVLDILGNIVYSTTNKQIRLQDIVFPNTAIDETEVLTSGIVNYVAGYMSSSKSISFGEYKNKLTSIKNSIGFKLGGFTDKSKFKLILDSRTPLNAGNVFIPEENYNIFLNNSSPISVINYSGVIIEVQQSGFVIRGYNNEIPAFKYYTSLSSSNDSEINVGGVSESFIDWNPNRTYSKDTIIKYLNNYYRVNKTFTTNDSFSNSNLTQLPFLPATGGVNARFKTKFIKTSVNVLPYGTKLSTVQDVVDFMLGYEAYLRDQGFKFEYFDGETSVISDWKTSCREFMFWTTQNWQEGALISLSPAADQLYLESTYGVVDDVINGFYGYTLLKSDGRTLSSNLIKISRQDKNTFKIEPINTEDGIYSCQLPIVQKEHVVLIDNTSIFGDVIYQPATGYRQERIKVLGYKTTDWDGSLNIPGFMYSEINIGDWQDWTEYQIGDIVKYKEFYYIANNKISSQEFFNYSDWSKLTDVPQSGLITNFEYKTNQFADFYNLDTDNFDVDQQKLAQHLIGYQKRNYLENIINDEVSQYKFYQGMIQDKGTRNSLDKLFDVLSATNRESLDFYEEWAIKQGQYGASEGFEEIEFKLQENKFQSDSQVFQLTNSDEIDTSIVYSIKDFEVFRKPTNYNNSIFPVVSDFDQYTNDSGYVFTEDVKYSLNSYDDILNLNITDLKDRDYLWVGKGDLDWDVLNYEISNLNLIKLETLPSKVVETNAAYQIELTVNKTPSNINVGDIIGIRDVIISNNTPDDSTDYPVARQTQLQVDGFFKVVKKSLNTLIVDSEEQLEPIDECLGLVTKFVSVRVNDYTDANVIAQQGLEDNSLLWVDNQDNNWKVLYSKKPFDLLQKIPGEEFGEKNTFGDSVATDGRNVTLAIGNPTAGSTVNVITLDSTETDSGSQVQIGDYVEQEQSNGRIAYGRIISVNSNISISVIAPRDKNSFADTLFNNVDSIVHEVSGSNLGIPNSVFSQEQREGKVSVYSRGGNNQNYQFVQELTPERSISDLNRGYGKSTAISADGKFLLVGSPDASNVKSKFRGDFDPAADYQNGEVVRYSEQLWEVVIDIQGADAAQPFGSFGAIAEVYDKYNLLNGEDIFANIITGNYPFADVQSDHILVRAFKDQYVATGPGDTVVLDWYLRTTANQQPIFQDRQPFDGAIPEITESLLESGLVIQKKVDVVLYVETITTLPSIGDQIESENVFGYVNYIYTEEGAATIYVERTAGSWPVTGSLFFETGEFVGEFVRSAPIETTDTSQDLGGYWYFELGQTYNIATPLVDEGRALAVKNIIPAGETSTGATGSNIYDLNNTVSNIGDNSVNSYFRTLTYQGNPGPAGSFNIQESDLFVVRAPRDLTDISNNGDEIGLLFLKFPNINDGTFIDITVAGVTYDQINKKHTLVDKWDGYIDYESDESVPGTGLPWEPRIGQNIRDVQTRATAKVTYYQKFNNSRARIYVKNVQGEWSTEASTIELLKLVNDPDPLYREDQDLGPISTVSLGADSLNIGDLFVFQLDTPITEVPDQDTIIGAEYIIYKDSELLGLPTEPNIPSANNFDYKPVYSIPANAAGISNNLNNFGYFTVYERQSISNFNIVNSFIVPDQIDNLRLGSEIKITKQNEMYKAFIACAGNGTQENPGRIYFVNNGVDEEGIQYNWELAKDKRYKGVFDQNRNYFIGEIVYYQGYFYTALTNIAGDGNTFVELEWEIATSDQIRSLDYIGYIPNNTGNYPEDYDYKGFFTTERNYVVGEIVQYFNGDFYRALRNIPINYTGFFNNNGTIEVPAEDWELIDFTLGGDESLGIITDSLINFARSFDVSDNGEVVVTTADYLDGTTRIIVYRNVNGNYQKSQELLIPYENNIVSINDTKINFGRSVSISQDGRLIAVSAPGADDSTAGEDIGAVYVYTQENGTFTLSQKLISANPTRGERFGELIQFDGQTLHVSAFNAASDDVTIFDSGSTVFDGEFTYFKNETPNNGVVYSYDRIDTSLIFGQTIDYHTYFDRDQEKLIDYFGRNILAKNNHLYISVPEYENIDGKKGIILDYRRNDSIRLWETRREFVPPADLNKIKQVKLYSLTQNKILANLDYIDPVQGKIAGPADEEIRFKTSIDPATYSQSSISAVNVNDTNTWGPDQVGSVWWDLTNAKFLNVYQGNAIYKNNNFNTLAPGGSIDVYEWVETVYPPAEWNELSGTVRGEAEGISGTTKYVASYSIRRVYDDISKQFTTYYYYWVKDKISVPDLPSRTISINNVAKLIEDPIGQNYKFLSIYDSSSFALHNCNDLIEGQDTILNIQYWTTGNETSNIHNQYQIITEGLGTSKPNSELIKKFVDSLVGFDEQSRPVPDISLSPKDRYGIFNKPRQSMFVNKTEALKQIVERVNSIFKENLIVDISDISKLQEQDPVPSVTSGKYDTIVDSEIDLDFVEVVRAETAQLAPVVQDGQIVRVDIVNPGRGYVNTPSYTVNGQGSDAEIDFTINNLGQITNVEIINSGYNYNENTTISIRPYTALVKNDSTILGKWALYRLVNDSWNRIATQAYDVTIYWNYIDWYDDEYSSFTEIDHVINQSFSLQGLDDNIGDIVKILNVGGEGWLLLEKIDNQDTIDYTVNYKTVGKQSGTIELKDNLYNFNDNAVGFDNQTFDTQFFDLQPVIETRIILNALKDDIFVNTLETQYNDLFFVGLRYIFSEQGYVDWAFKTSFIKAQHNVGSLEQKPTFKNDNLSSFEDYISEVKPYKAKIREYVSNYDKTDVSPTVVSDFDTPPRYNSETQTITATDVRVVDNVLIGTGLISDADRLWLNNLTYSVTEIEIADPGQGYLSAPQVIIDGNAEAFVSIGPLGQITKVFVANKGSGYLTIPKITINGSLRDGGTPARLSAVLGESLVRTMHTIVKFDRVSGAFFITQLNETETFLGNGSKTDFDLKWPMDMRTNTVEIFVNGELVLNSNYDFENYLGQNSNYDKYYGRISFINPPANNSVIEVNYKKSVNMLDAQDRINLFYNPTEGQIGNDVAQLMDGVDYGGVEVKSFGFEGPTGWDTDSWYTGAWDLFDETFQDESFTTDGSTLVFNLSKPLESSVKYNVYINGTRVDDDNWDGTSSVDNPYAIMAPIVGDGVTNTFTFDNEIGYRQALAELGDSSGNNNPPDDAVITIRKASSDGSLKLNEASFDTKLQGGDLAYTTATGINAEDIDVDGDGFVTVTTSKGPEEVVPGQVMDTVDITVYERPNSGTSLLETSLYKGDGTTQTFALPNRPFSESGVFVKVDYRVQGLQDYRIDIVNKTLTFYTPPNADANIVIITSGIGGKNIIDYGEFTTDGQNQEFRTSIEFSEENSAYVTLNGKQFPFEVISSADGFSIIKFTTPPQANRLVQYAIFDSDVQTFSQISVEEIIADGSSAFYELARTPFEQQPASYYTVVTVNDERVLNAGYSEIFTVEENILKYDLKKWQIPVGSVEGIEIKVFLNNRELQFLQEWTYEGAASFNPNIPDDAQEGSTIILNKGIANTGDTLKVFIISSGEYRFGYFDSSAEFVDTSGKQIPAVLTPTIEDGEITAVEINNAGRGYSNQSLIVASGDGEGAEFSIVVDEVGSIKEVNILNSGTGYTEADLNIEIITLPAVIYFDEIFNDGDSIKVYQFSNHDSLGIERFNYDVVERTQMTVGSEGYHEYRLLKNNLLELTKEALSVKYVWISVNGKWLTPTADYVLLENKKSIQFITDLNAYDVIDVIHFAGNPIENRLGWRQFKDMLNKTTYLRLSADKEFKLSKDLNWYDRSIEVEGDVDNLPQPTSNSKNPGVLFIQGERIEYFRREGNVLKQLRRGTLGTGIKDVYTLGTIFYDQSLDSVLPYTDSEERFTAISGQYFDMKTLYPVDSPTITVESITYDFNNNTVFPVRVAGVYEQIATVTGTGFRPDVRVIMQDENGQPRELEKVSSTETEIQFHTETMPVGAYDLVIYNPPEETPAIRAETSLVVSKFLPYVQVLVPYEPEAFTDVVKNPVELGEWYKAPFDEGGIPEEYWQALNIEVFANGRRLRKSPLKVYDITQGQFSPDGDVDIQAEYAVNKNEGAYVRLTEPPEPNTTLTIVRKLGLDWRDVETTTPLVFKPLSSSESKVASFLRGTTINLPR